MMTSIGELRVRVAGGKLVGIHFIEKEEVHEEILNQVQDDAPAKVEAQLREYFEGKRKVFELEYELVKGTEFERKVWGEIGKIPYGETVSYKELAGRVGRPKAVRAVANACGKNPLPVVVPCHRVVGSPSASLRVNSFIMNLGGYSGGLWRKKWLLEHEEADVLVKKRGAR